jgi:hypothetical protein
VARGATLAVPHLGIGEEEEEKEKGGKRRRKRKREGIGMENGRKRRWTQDNETDKEEKLRGREAA